MSTDDFLPRLVDQLAALPAVEAVALGGSRAQGLHRPDSDYDLGLYYRGAFSVEAVRDLGWLGEISELGGWGGGVFNGGGWLTVEGHQVDLHYRDLDRIDELLAEAERGEFATEPLLFHLAGIPTYLLLAELSVNQTLSGTLPKPTYPEALKRQAPHQWWGRAAMTFSYAIAGGARRGNVVLALGLTAQAITFAAHAVLAARGRWITNEKQLLRLAGLTELDAAIAELPAEPDALAEGIERIRDRCAETLAESGVTVSTAD